MTNRINFEGTPDYESLYPVQSFFNSISDEDFVAKLDNLTKGIGAHTEKVHCIFLNDLDEYDIEQTGGKIPDKIEFSFDWGEEVYVDIETFRGFLETACAAYLQEHPADRTTVKEYLARPQPSLKRNN